MSYMRNGRMVENRGPWPLYHIPGFNYVLEFLATIALFFTTMFSPAAAHKIRRDRKPTSGPRFGGGGGGGSGPGGDGGSGGGPRISGMGNLPSGAASGCCGRSCG